MNKVDKNIKRKSLTVVPNINIFIRCTKFWTLPAIVIWSRAGSTKDFGGGSGLGQLLTVWQLQQTDERSSLISLPGIIAFMGHSSVYLIGWTEYVIS